MARRAFRIADRHEGRARPRDQRQGDVVHARAEVGEHACRREHAVAHLRIRLWARRELADHAHTQSADVTGERRAIVRRRPPCGQRVVRVVAGDDL